MYTLKYTIEAYDPDPEALTASLHRIGYRYTKTNGDVYDHMIAHAVEGMSVRYLPVTADEDVANCKINDMRRHEHS